MGGEAVRGCDATCHFRIGERRGRTGTVTNTVDATILAVDVATVTAWASGTLKLQLEGTAPNHGRAASAGRRRGTGERRHRTATQTVTAATSAAGALTGAQLRLARVQVLISSTSAQLRLARVQVLVSAFGAQLRLSDVDVIVLAARWPHCRSAWASTGPRSSPTRLVRSTRRVVRSPSTSTGATVIRFLPRTGRVHARLCGRRHLHRGATATNDIGYTDTATDFGTLAAGSRRRIFALIQLGQPKPVIWAWVADGAGGYRGRFDGYKNAG
jgi:hypothetical protein